MLLFTSDYAVGVNAALSNQRNSERKARATKHFFPDILKTQSIFSFCYFAISKPEKYFHANFFLHKKKSQNGIFFPDKNVIKEILVCLRYLGMFFYSRFVVEKNDKKKARGSYEAEEKV